jgi:Plasmid pRiA4b ORF-3-like protein
MPDAQSIYRLKIRLEDLSPEIWRRVEVPADLTLSRLHRVIQVAFGWSDAHLHQFEGAGGSWRRRGTSAPRPRLKDGWLLCEVAPRERSGFWYVYDFGDGWEHHVLVEAELPPEPGVVYPRCLAGERACPPEDCGGVPGYADILDAVRHPDRPDADELLDWVGEDFNPEAFDLDATNLALARPVRRAARRH